MGATLRAARRAAEPVRCGTPRAARRHQYRGEPLDPACGDAYRAYRSANKRRLRDAERPERKAQTAAEVGAKPFQIPRCSRCKAPLADRAGAPRWELIEPFGFICLEACDSVLANTR